MPDTPTFDTRDDVDFVIIGSGAAGGIIAKELSTAGFSTVVLEQGKYRKTPEFTHDEIKYFLNGEWFGAAGESGMTFRKEAADEPQGGQFDPAMYAKTVGGSSVIFSAHLWRMRPVDFNERSKLGAIEGTNFADWPITYDELEPYYTKVEWDMGVSGAPGHSDPPRSKPFPMPPLPINASGAIMEKAAAALGLNADVQPHAILSQAHNGRAPCLQCGFCAFFGCEVGAKSSSLAAMIPLAEASGNCEIRPESTVFRIVRNAEGRVSEVLYYDKDGNEQGQKARAVVLSANGAESPRLLLESDNLANSSGFVGRNLMFNAHAGVNAVFENPLNEHKGVQATRVILDFYESDPARGFYGGGGIDARGGLMMTPLVYSAFGAPPSDKNWGAEYKDMIAHSFPRQMGMMVSATSLAMDRNNVTLHPENKDKWGRKAIVVTYKDHPDDIANAQFLQDKAQELLDAVGPERTWAQPVAETSGGVHLLGTCRMGDDPSTSVIDRNHRSHDVANLFICDGSSLVTSTRGQPTMTIMALAFRAADKIIEAARAGDV
ncbi:MAG: GMC family oxidoreductase [Woeseiaceae bacterium]